MEVSYESIRELLLCIFGRTLPADRDRLGRRPVVLLQRRAGAAVHDNFFNLL